VHAAVACILFFAFDKDVSLNFISAATLLAQADGATPSPSSLVEIVFAGGVTGVAIVVFLLLLSMAALALVVEQSITIRRTVLAPDELAAALKAELAQGRATRAVQLCEASACPLAAVVRAALLESDIGWSSAEKAMEDEAAEQAARLFRKTEYLSLVGNIAPMVGLLGTVVGMIFAFREVAETQGAARAADLASGIYQALVTTVGGLLVAIPALAAFAVLRNRVDGLMGEVMSTARDVLRPVKRALALRRQSAGGPPPVKEV
jgi:biopolymer transport protein ExbB